MSNRRTVAMEVNDDAGSLTPRGALRFFASELLQKGRNHKQPLPQQWICTPKESSKNSLGGFSHRVPSG
jgi:hypothetical protein